MGEYKVPQDVEAEDKIIGPLTMRQFIYVVIGFAWGALSFAIFRRVPLFFVVFGLPVALLFILLGVYKRQDQPFEKLFIALVSFWKNPRKRLWEKEPIAEVFKVNPAPPKAEPMVRDAAQVKGQLEKIVRAMESREGSLKRPELQERGEEQEIDGSDRIYLPEHLQAGAVPRVPLEVSQSDDMLDENSPSAHSIDQLIHDGAQKARESALAKMHSTRGVAGKPKETPPPSASEAGRAPDDILKKTLAGSNLRVNQIAERANQPASGVMKEGETIKLDQRQRLAG